MLIVFAVPMGVVNAWASSNNPFGFETQKHPLDYEYCRHDPNLFRGHGYECQTAPRPHPDLHKYKLKFVDGVGVCMISTGDNKLSQSNVQDLSTALQGQITRKYGPVKNPAGEVEKNGPGWTIMKYVWLPTTGSEGVGEVTELRLFVMESVYENQSKNWVIVNVYLTTNPTCEARIDEQAEQAF